MSNVNGGDYDLLRVDARIGISGQTFNDITVKEVILGESLLTPGLQTAITLQSWVYSDPQKLWGDYKSKYLTINMNDGTGISSRQMYVNQQIYRIDNRELDINVGQTETLTLHACDPTLLNDAQALISKSWKCTMPSEVVNYALKSCAGAQNVKVSDAGPAKDYVAENIHPFQVISQQSNVALYNGNDPSFLHYMTYEGMSPQTPQGTHYFKSLGEMISGVGLTEGSIFSTSETNGDLYNLTKVISFSFPCVFDYLSDLLNGIGIGNSLSTINPFNQAGSLFGGAIGGAIGGCGIGQGNHKTAITNSGSAQQQNSCEMGVEQYLLLRQARMGLLEKDKIALRLTIPWNSNLHVGQMIGFTWIGKSGENVGVPIYGSGNYLIVALKHNIQLGGFATTTLDCITDTTG